MTQSTILVISGVPGAGKSTVARQLASRFSRAAHIEADVLQQMIVAGGVWPDPELNEESTRQLRLRLHNTCVLARSFAAAGFCAVLDDIYVGERIAQLREELAEEPFQFVMLNPSLDALRRRNAQRDRRDVFFQAEYLYEIVQTQTERIGLWLDTSDQSAVQTVDSIVASLPIAWPEPFRRE